MNVCGMRHVAYRRGLDVGGGVDEKAGNGAPGWWIEGGVSVNGMV